MTGTSSSSFRPTPRARTRSSSPPSAHPAEGQRRRVEAAAPDTRAHVVDGDPARPEGGADASRVVPPGCGEVALRAAVLEAHGVAIAGGRVRGGVTHDDDLAARLEETPQRLARLDVGGDTQQRQDQ